MNTNTKTNAFAQSSIDDLLLSFKWFRRPEAAPPAPVVMLGRIDSLVALVKTNVVKQYTYCPENCTPFHKSGLYAKETRDIVIRIEDNSEMAVFQEEFDAAIKLLTEVVKSPLFEKYHSLLTVKK